MTHLTAFQFQILLLTAVILTASSSSLGQRKPATINGVRTTAPARPPSRPVTTRSAPTKTVPVFSPTHPVSTQALAKPYKTPVITQVSTPKPTPVLRQGGPVLRQAPTPTTDDKVRARYRDLMQKNSKPPDYPENSWRVLMWDKANYDVRGKNYRPLKTNMIITGSDLINH